MENIFYVREYILFYINACYLFFLFRLFLSFYLFPNVVASFLIHPVCLCHTLSQSFFLSLPPFRSIPFFSFTVSFSFHSFFFSLYVCHYFPLCLFHTHSYLQFLLSLSLSLIFLLYFLTVYFMLSFSLYLSLPPSLFFSILSFFSNSCLYRSLPLSSFCSVFLFYPLLFSISVFASIFFFLFHSLSF